MRVGVWVRESDRCEGESDFIGRQTGERGMWVCVRAKERMVYVRGERFDWSVYGYACAGEREIARAQVLIMSK